MNPFEFLYTCGKTGKNRFEACGGGRHAYLVKAKEDAFYKNRIEALLSQEP